MNLNQNRLGRDTSQNIRASGHMPLFPQRSSTSEKRTYHCITLFSVQISLTQDYFGCFFFLDEKITIIL